MPSDYLPEPLFSLPPPAADFRLMLRRHVTRRVVESLRAGRERRARARTTAQIRALAEWVRQRVVRSLGPVAWGPSAPPVRPRLISRHSADGFSIENVVFESLPGWKVNATVWRPDPRRWPPPWPGIVTPVGHNGKYYASEQLPPQVFAHHGYLSVSFDPPGFGEKTEGNNHFVDGVCGYLVGLNPLRYFVADALRAVDYLASRADVDRAGGFAMTGVSGGGFTSIIAPMLDRRITAIGPSCFGLQEVVHPVRNGYGGCPEVLFAGRYGDGIEIADLMIAARFVPQFMMAGALDDALDIRHVRVLAGEVAALYERAGCGDRFRFFADPASGHAYTPRQAEQFIQWLRARRGDIRQPMGRSGARPRLRLLPAARLQCGLSRSASMRSLARDRAGELAAVRELRGLPRRLRRLAGLEGGRPPAAVSAAPVQRVWAHGLHELSLRVEPDLEIPATLMQRVDHRSGGLAILFFDERGRWAPLARGGWLARAGAFLERTGPDIAVLSVDLRGWGDTRPMAAPFDLSSWGGADRWLGYHTAALGDPLLAMRLRDAQAALDYLRTPRGPRPRRVVAGGTGQGAVVAALLAAINPGIAAVILRDFPAALGLLMEDEAPTWPHDLYCPGLLEITDLPELLAALRRPVALAGPLDARQQSLAPGTARRLLRRAGARPTWLAPNAADAGLVTWVRSLVPPPSHP